MPPAKYASHTKEATAALAREVGIRAQPTVCACQVNVS